MKRERMPRIGACKLPTPTQGGMPISSNIHASTMPPPLRPLSRLRAPNVLTNSCIRNRGQLPCPSRPISTHPYRNNPTIANFRTSGIRWNYVFYALSLTLGVGAGFALTGYVTSRTRPPVPGSDTDMLALEYLADEMDNLEIVKHMRAESVNPLGAPQEPGKSQTGWLELDTQPSTEEIVKGDTTTRIFTERSLAGIQGLGIRRVFWNTETRELVAVVWIGPRLTGWPGIAHGGAIATIFEEAMYRMIAGPKASLGAYNVKCHSQQSELTEAESVPPPTSMSVTYARPTTSSNIYVLRSSFSTPNLPQEEPAPEPAPAKSWLPSGKDFTKQHTSTAPQPPVEISATLESLDGEVKVRAKGVWPASAMPKANA